MKVTRSQIREIIREHQADAEAKYLLNEGFLDVLKKLGKFAMGAFKKAKEATGQFKEALDAEVLKSSMEPKVLEAAAEKHGSKLKDARQALLKDIMADIEGEGDEGQKQRLAVAILNYVWSNAGTQS
jgi:hypothetical protein